MALVFHFEGGRVYSVTETHLDRFKYLRVVKAYFSGIFDITVMRPLILGAGHFCRSCGSKVAKFRVFIKIKD